LLVISILIAALHTPAARRYALKQAIQILGKQGVTFDASSVDYNLLELSAVLDNVTVRSPQAPDLPAVAHADRIWVNLSLRKLLAGQYYVENADVRNPSVHVVVDEQGRDNIPRLPEKEDTGETDYLIDQLKIGGASVRYEDRKQHIDATLPISEITVDGNPVTKNHDIRLITNQPGQILFERRTLPLRGLAANLVLEKKALDVKNASLDIGGSTVTLSGRMDNFDDPRYDFKAASTLSLDSLARFAGASQKVSGTVNLVLAANGPLSQFKATARVDGQNLTVEQFSNLDLKAEAAYDRAANRARLDSFNVVSPAGTIQGKADLALTSPAGQSTLNASTRGLDLGRVSSTLRLPVRLASRATADIAANWPALDFDKASGDATVRLAATAATPSKDVVPVSGTVRVKSAGDRIVAGIDSIRALGAGASGQVTVVNRRSLGGQIKLAAPDLTATLAGAEAFLGRQPGTLAGTRIAGSLTADARLGGTVDRPNVTATIESPALEAGTLTGIALNADVDYNPSRLEIKSATIGWQNQQVTGNGTVGLQGRAPVLDLTAQASNVSIETVLAGLNRKDIPASGTINLETKVGGTTKDPLADVKITGTDLTAYQEKFGNLTGTAQLAGQVLTLRELTLNKPQPGGDGTLRVTGSYQLENKEYTLNLDSNNLKLTSMALPDGTPVRGEISLKAEGQGTADNPSLNLKADVGNLQYGDQELGNVNLQARLLNQQANVQANIPRFNLNATANIGIQEPYPTTFEVKADNTNLATLPLKLEKPLEGNVTATVRGAGNLKEYEKGQASVEVAALNLTWNGQPVRTEGPLVAHYNGSVLSIERATVIARDSRLSVNGKLPLEESAGPGAINVQGTIDLATLLTYVPLQQPIEASGSAKIEGTITGTLKRIDPNVTIALDNGYFFSRGLNPPLSGVTLRAQIRDGALNLENLTSNWGVATLKASGEVPFALLPASLPIELPRRSGPAQFTAELNGLDLATVEALPSNMGGAVSVRLEAQAEKPELEALTGKLTFPELRFHLGSYAIEQKGTSTVALTNGTADVQNFQLMGPGTDVRLAGTAGLTGDRPLDLRLNGTADAAIITAFSEQVRAQGTTELQLAVRGTAADPKPEGSVQLTNAQFSMRDPRISADAVNARFELTGSTINLARLDGTLNGGSLSGGGTVQIAKGELMNTNLNVGVQGLFLDYPAGLKTVSNVRLALRNQSSNLVVGGEVTIIEGGFTDDLNLDSGVLAAMSAPRGVDLTSERKPMLESVRLDLGVKTANPIVVDNNLAKAEISADLRVLGTPYQPGLSGRLEIEEGGQIKLQERQYQVERGIITFTNERRIEPGLDIVATTSAGGYDIRLQVTGEPGKTETTLTSDPPLPEPDILAVLLTGKKLEDIRGQEYEIARNQVLSYLTGRVGSALGRGIAGATGLSMVRIEPTLIANEADPGARLTVGQDITRDLNLIYSMDLVNSSDQIYVAEYDLTKRFVARGVRQSDGSFRMDFRHDVRFGGIPEPKKTGRRGQGRIGNISILGETYFPQEKVADKLGVESGDRYNFFDIRKGIDRIAKMYAKQNLLEANVRLKRDRTADNVDLTLNIDHGPEVDFVYEGFSPDGDLKKRVREIWQSGVFDAQRGEDAVSAIRESLVKGHHLQPKIEYSITKPAAETKRVLFDVQPGPEFRDVDLVFEGSQGIEPKTLRKIIDASKMSTDVYTKPGRVTELLTRYYQEQGYLDATLASPRYELDEQTRTGKVVFPVNEGPLYRIANVGFEGNTIFDDARLAQAVPLPKGEAYRPVLRERALQAIRELYWEKGYNDLDSESLLNRNKDAGTVDITINLQEHRQGIVKEMVVEGNRNTSENLIRTQLEIKTGEVLNLQKVSNSRRNLYNSGAYSLVEILRDEIGVADKAAEADRTQKQGAGEKPVRLTVRVREVQPFQFRYGGFYDTERGPGAILDFANRNSLGSARVLGLRTRYDSQLQEARVYFTQPLLRRFPISTTASPYIRRERNPATADADPFNVDRVGLSILQEGRFRNNYVLNYGYRIERSRTYDPGPNPVFDIPLRIAALTATLTRETRDEVLDASRGQFISSAFQWSPQILGSELRFIKYFGQYFRYFPLQAPKVELFTNKVERPRLVFATGVRLGLAKGLGGQEIPLSERFFAGGGTTVRGFEQNSLGPIGADRLPRGGDGMLVINNELRFPLIKWFDGVTFIDIGNVYPKISDFSFTDLRKAGGLGLRLRTPWFLLRADYGVKFDRRTGESLGRYYISIGHAF
jgi:outer membrane protein assembly complex protein YaeT